MYQIFFIHSSVDGHLGYFHILAMAKSAAMNIEIHVSFQIILEKIISFFFSCDRDIFLPETEPTFLGPETYTSYVPL